MAIPFWKPSADACAKKLKSSIPSQAVDASSLNLPENSGSASQQEILDALPVLVFLERDGMVVYANTEARGALGLSEGEWVPRPVEDLLWGLFPGTAEPLTQLMRTRTGSPFHATLPATSGRLLPVEGTYSLLNAELREAVIVAHPSGRERAPKSRLTEDVLASIPEAIVIVHNGRVLYTNPSFTQLFGYTAEEVSGNSLRELIVPETRLHEVAMVEREVDREGRIDIQTVRMNKKGDLLDVALVAGPLGVEGGNVGYVLSFRNIGERRQAEARLQKDALYDVLTGLPNRTLFMDRIAMALNRRSRRTDQSCGVLILDLDRFGDINAALGHAAGEALLKAVGERLRAALRPQDSASRIGADEFAILIENIIDSSDLEIVATRILNEIERPFEIFGNFIRASASLGVAITGADPTNPEMLVLNADFAMYRAKQEGGGGFEIFDKRLESPAKTHRQPERDFRRVLEKREFEVWYQPIYRLETGKLEGFESLLRLRKADGSIESFHEMMMVAEQVGLSITLGREVLNTVCRQLADWTVAMPSEEFVVTLSLTPRQFYHPELVETVRKALTATRINPSRLLFEVSETVLSENLDKAAEILKRLAELKVRIAADDFGAGLAPLDYLQRLPVDLVKMSARLTSAALSDDRSLAMFESLIHLAHAMGAEVVAQGIEHTQQLDALCRMGCEFGMGHLLSYALDPAHATKLAGAGCWAIAVTA